MNEKKFNVVDMVELQLIENAVSARLSEIEEAKNSREFASAQKELEEVEENYKEKNNEYNALEGKRKKLEDTVEMQNEKIKGNENKLFSGTITSTKELESYQEEIKILKEKNSEMEDKILEIMIEMEEKSESLKQTKDKRDKTEADVNRLRDEIDEKMEVLKNIVEGLKKRKESVISRIPVDYLKKYNELKNKRGGIAVAVLKDNFCSVCNMEIPTIAAEEMEDIDKVYRCPLCGRMAVMYRGEIDTIKKELE